MARRQERRNANNFLPRPENNHHQRLTSTLSDLPSVPERLVFSYSFTKQDEESFGITIVGGKDAVSGGIFVKNITTSGVCGRNGGVREGDQILEINGQSLVGVTHAQAVKLFRLCKRDINLLISRLVESKPVETPLSQYHGQLVSTSEEGCADMEPFLLEHKTLLE